MIIERCVNDPVRKLAGITKRMILQHFDISRQAHQQQLHKVRRREGEDAIVVELVQAIRQHHPRMGTRKLLRKIMPKVQKRGFSMGRDRLFELLRARGLLVPVKRRATRTTRSGLFRCPNLLADLTLTQPHQAWVGDITYITLERGFAYLALLTDPFSRFIVGYDLSLSLAVEGCQRALKMAVGHTTHSLAGLIHHSDHGVQYTARPYHALLSDHQIRPSMGEVGNCYENALAERMNGILKLEYGLDSLFVDLDQARAATEQAVYLYNYDRPHLSLDYRVPVEAHMTSKLYSKQ